MSDKLKFNTEDKMETSLFIQKVGVVRSGTPGHATVNDTRNAPCAKGMGGY